MYHLPTSVTGKSDRRDDEENRADDGELGEWLGLPRVKPSLLEAFVKVLNRRLGINPLFAMNRKQ